MSNTELSATIAKSIRDAIVEGRLAVDDRLPSESELAEQFEVGRSTVREALKRLAAQSLIRTERGAFGGAFVQRLSYADAQAQHVTTSTLLLSMNEVSFVTACQARFALERACVDLACAHRQAADLADMRAEITRQSQPDLSDEGFCASDVRLHRALVDSAQNPVLSYQLAGAVEAMQPLMNMITFSDRSRSEITRYHTMMVDAVEARQPPKVVRALECLEIYTLELGRGKILARKQTPAR
ncbi:FadR/GntR family transcriptional regulator [Tropicibacter naphthalenivorans]|uniref:Putative L-lactate dehydrogenase operon regulatory protein n=1 Tax=Tropicibacter naphthalenivorans TaxID=441103 RepID=A0A0P1GH32_9RHOB|nr:GntR family transcriptional regulator [Tropicibacter naphthalenivorans]CUH74970.1 Putative L-lactate dehydrogenase operon regulatory protein [Tropicibacter naphthalenivorans]SMC47705.1 transcriptional regulator, GntR family [Tropicibacter naphthalenivorans]